MRILLIATRDPTGPPTGRSTSIGTLLRALRDLDHEVDLVVLAPEVADEQRLPDGVHLHRLAPPRPARWCWSALTRTTRLQLSLNECLYVSGPLAAEVSAIADQGRCDVVIADMIRTYELAKATGLPMIVDLDDLLSARYERMIAEGARTDSLTGYYPVPGVVRGVLSRLATQLVRIEARLQRRREEVAVREAPVASLVSPVEAAQLERRTGRRVWVAPMAVALPDGAAAAPGSSALERTAAFVGGLDYGPNLDAVMWFQDEVLPAWDRLELGPIELQVFGRCPDKVREVVHDDRVRLRGFVPDLFAELARCPVFAAPIRSGGGVKTKVVEAMALGLPVVSTSFGVEAIDVADGRGCLVADSADGFARAIDRALADPPAMADLAAVARGVAQRDFSPAGRARAWGRMLAAATAGTPSAPGRPDPTDQLAARRR